MYEMRGTVMFTLPVVTGEGKNGQWKKQEFVIEVPGKFAKKVKFIAWGDVLDSVTLKTGLVVNVTFDLESREYNGRWYTDARAKNIVVGDGSAEPEPGEEPMPEDNEPLPF